MSERADLWVLLLVVIIVLIWIYYHIRKWLTSPVNRQLLLLADAADPPEHVARVLEAAGYQMTSGKFKMPLAVRLNGEKLSSRLYIDGIAESGGDRFLVLLSKSRKPVTLSGSGLRDTFLKYRAAIPAAKGIVYVDTDHEKIYQIIFEWDE